MIDSQAIPGTPPKIPPKKLAALWKRILARLLDDGILTVFSSFFTAILFAGIIFAFPSQFPSFTNENSLQTFDTLIECTGSQISNSCRDLFREARFFSALYLLTFTLLSAGYYTLAIKRYNQTLGKKVLGIEVFNLHSFKSLTYIQAFLRHLPWLLIYPIGIVGMLFFWERYFEIQIHSQMVQMWNIIVVTQIVLNEFRQGWHDVLAVTTVVDVSEDEEDDSK